MKFIILYLLAVILCLAFTVRAQEAYIGTVTVFSEDGDKFTLFMNEDQKNPSPDSKVFAQNIIDLKVLFRVVFENKAIATIKNNNNFFKLTVDEGGPEKTWHVKLQNSNGYDLKIE
jgi:hypothetical protein